MDSPQDNRDLRSASQSWKRDRDNRHKWAYGTTGATDVKTDLMGNAIGSLTPGQEAKLRPMGKWSEWAPGPRRWEHNVVKPRARGGHNRDLPSGRVRAKIHAKVDMQEPISQSLLDLAGASLPAGGGGVERRFSISDNILYSFDRADTPGLRPVALEAFVKPTAGRDTERLVEKEYEVLDTEGEALRGRRARRLLKQAAAAAGAAGEGGDVRSSSAPVTTDTSAPPRTDTSKKEEDVDLEGYEWV